MHRTIDPSCLLFARFVEYAESFAAPTRKPNGLAHAATTTAAMKSPFLPGRSRPGAPAKTRCLRYRGGRGIAVRPPPPLLAPLEDAPDEVEPEPEPPDEPEPLDPDDDGRLAVPLELLPEPGVYPTPLIMRP